MDFCLMTYEDVEHWLDKRVADFYKRYGWRWVTDTCGPFEELRAIATEVFMDCYHSHKKQKSDFVTWVGNKVWYRLLDVLRKNTTYKRIEADLEAYPYVGREFNLDDFISGLSRDAGEVIRMVTLDTPLEISIGIVQVGRNTPAVFRDVLKQHLRDIGWTWDRIKNTFQEIREAL